MTYKRMIPIGRGKHAHIWIFLENMVMEKIQKRQIEVTFQMEEKPINTPQIICYMVMLVWFRQVILKYRRSGTPTDYWGRKIHQCGQN